MVITLKWRRKVQRLGNAFYVSIPGVWIENNNVKKGSEIEIEFSTDGSLKLLSEVSHD